MIVDMSESKGGTLIYLFFSALQTTLKRPFDGRLNDNAGVAFDLSNSDVVTLKLG